jgi:hypothetical protein
VAALVGGLFHSTNGAKHQLYLRLALHYSVLVANMRKAIATISGQMARFTAFQEKARSRSDRASLLCGNLEIRQQAAVQFQPVSLYRLGRWYGLADDPPQFGCNAIQHRALLLHPLRVVVDLAGDTGHDLLLVCTENPIRVDDVTESPKLAE